MATYNYVRYLDPPAPFLDIGASADEISDPSLIPAQLDTGADASSIPIDLADELGLQVTGNVVLYSATGDRAIRNIYEVFFTVEQYSPVKCRVTMWHEDYVLLGRDILNQYHITLDGPNLTLTVTR